MPARKRPGPSVGPLQPDQYRPAPKGGSKPEDRRDDLFARPGPGEVPWEDWQEQDPKARFAESEKYRKEQVQREKAREKQRRGLQGKALEDFGEVKSLDGGFCRLAGAVLDALVPKVGDKGKVQLNVNVPVPNAGSPVKISFKLAGTAERDAKGVKFRPELAVGVLGQVKFGIGPVALEVFAKAGLSGYIEAYADKGAEVFRLLLLGVRTVLRTKSKAFADLIFTDDQALQAWDQMDEDDYVEWAVGTYWSVGASAKSKTNEEKKGGASYTEQSYTSTRLDKNNGKRRKGMQTKEVNTLKLALEPWGLEFKYVCVYRHRRLVSMEIEAVGEAMVDVNKLNANIIGAQAISQYLATAGGMMQRQAGMSGEGARLLGGMIRGSSQLVSGGVGVDIAAQKAMDRLKALGGVKVGWKLNLKGKRDMTAKKSSIQVCLERASTLELGGNDRDLVYVLLENLQEVFNLEKEI